MMEQINVDDDESQRGANMTQDVDNVIVPPEASDPVYDDTAVGVTDSKTGNRGYFQAALTKYKLYIGVGILGFILLLSIILGVSLSGNKNKNSLGYDNGNVGGGYDSVPDFAPSGNGDTANDYSMANFPLNGANEVALLNLLELTFNDLGFPTRHFQNFNTDESPQLSAIQWLADSKQYNMLPIIRKIQRYALATFFYSTYAIPHAYLTNELPWKSEDNWLNDDTHECEWEGVICDDSGETVIGISLNDHRISGTLPLDLGLLGSSLQTFEVSSNFIYMDGPDLDLFNFLPNLQELKMDDNYIVGRTGLPTSLQNLRHLEKLILSYNLLQGTIPTNYFNNMQKLTHLEMESNYIAGSLPHSLMNLESLVYLYARRNSFHFSFAFLLQQVHWPKIFSLWLDNNNVSGPIPTEIGLLTGLASLSITNSSLVGTIPSEMSNLVGLRRLWLYGNQLTGAIPYELGENLKSLEVVELHSNNFTGSMPVEICSTIEKSSYRFKELSVDCDEVACESCCTKCF